MRRRRSKNKLALLRVLGPLAKAVVDGMAQSQTNEEKKRAAQKKGCGSCNGGK